MSQRRTGIVTADGAPVTLLGTPVEVGMAAPDFACVALDADEVPLVVHLADTPATTRLFSVVPSVDTSVCEVQTVRFAYEVGRYGERVAAYTVSVDTPYAMQRFCAAKDVANLTMLSDYRPERSFGLGWGLLMAEDGELARAVYVIDAAGIVRHAQIAGDSGHHPDYDSALEALRAVADAI